jgi:hypothetical protein
MDRKEARTTTTGTVDVRHLQPITTTYKEAIWYSLPHTVFFVLNVIMLKVD